MIRLALFGAGRWAREAHVASLAKLEGVQITHVASSDGASARELAGSLGKGAQAWAAADLVVALGELARAGTADGEKLDGVIIATPPDTHAELATAALGAKLPVLCELPLATDPVAARALATAAADAGLLAATTLPRPMLYGGDAVRALLPELGDLQRAKLTVRLPDTPLPMLLGLGASALVTLFGPGRATADRTLAFDRHAHLTGILDLSAESKDGFTGLDVEGARGILRWSWARPGAITLELKDDDKDPLDRSVEVARELADAFVFTRRFTEAVRQGATSLDGLPSFADGAATIELAASIGRAMQR